MKTKRAKSAETFLIIAVIFIISAVANDYFNNSFSNFITVIFSIMGSIFLAIAIYKAVKSNP